MKLATDLGFAEEWARFAGPHVIRNFAAPGRQRPFFPAITRQNPDLGYEFMSVLGRGGKRRLFLRLASTRLLAKATP